MIKYEIFDIRNGSALRTVRGEWLARLLSRRPFLDYARQGEGW